MTEDRLPLAELLQKAGDGDFLRAVAGAVLQLRKESEKALVAVIQEAWIGGVSARRVDELVQAMGPAGISKSTVSKLCKDIDERVGAFLERPLEGEWPYLWLDPDPLQVRGGRRAGSRPP